MKYSFVILPLFWTTLSLGQSKSRVDLEDVDIKGQLMNQGRVRLVGRDSSSLEEKLYLRMNYKQEILDEKREKDNLLQY
ncbi:MAG: hypothetical protein R2827_15955 [Bdellovibrionales bacterium]